MLRTGHFSPLVGGWLVGRKYLVYIRTFMGLKYICKLTLALLTLANNQSTIKIL